MIKLQRPTTNEGPSASFMGRIIDAIEELQRLLTPGPGLGKASNGQLYVIPTPDKGGSTELAALSGTPKVLASTQGTQDVDTYDRSTDTVPVTFNVITDIQYDETTHKLSYRTRTVTSAWITTISAESALVDITTAEACE